MRFDPYSADTEAYRHLLGLARHLSQTDLPADVRGLVEVRVSQISGCGFCLAFHAAAARRAGVSQRKMDLVAGWREAPDFTGKERAALALAEEMARIGDDRRVTDATWTAAQNAFSKSELAALLYAVGLVKVWNLLNVASEFPADGNLPKVDA